MRRCDARLATQARYTALPRALHDKSRPARPPLAVFGAVDFNYDPVARTCICPAGKSLYRRGAARVTRDHIGAHFRGAERDCGPCALRAQCLRTPKTTPVRNVAFFHGRVSTRHVHHTALMRNRIDSPEGRAQYAQRFATVEPVLRTCARTSASISSRCKAAPRSTRNGSATVSYTTSRSSQTTDTPPDEAHRTDLLRSGRPVHANLARNALSAAARFCSLALKRAGTFGNAFSYSFNASFCCGRSNRTRAQRAYTSPVCSKHCWTAVLRVFGETPAMLQVPG